MVLAALGSLWAESAGEEFAWRTLERALASDVAGDEDEVENREGRSGFVLQCGYRGDGRVERSLKAVSSCEGRTSGDECCGRLCLSVWI